MSIRQCVGRVVDLLDVWCTKDTRFAQLFVALASDLEQRIFATVRNAQEHTLKVKDKLRRGEKRENNAD